MKTVIMVAVTVAALTISAYSGERKGDPFTFHDPDRDFTLAVMAYSMGIPAPGLETETGIISGIAAAAERKTSSIDRGAMLGGQMVVPVLRSGPIPGSIMIDMGVLLHAVQEVGVAAAGGGVDKDGVMASAASYAAEHPIKTSLGIIAVAAGANYAYQKNKDDKNDDTQDNTGPGDDGNGNIVINNNTGTIVINYSGDDSGTQTGDDANGVGAQ